MQASINGSCAGHLLESNYDSACFLLPPTPPFRLVLASSTVGKWTPRRRIAITPPIWRRLVRAIRRFVVGIGRVGYAPRLVSSPETEPPAGDVFPKLGGNKNPPNCELLAQHKKVQQWPSVRSIGRSWASFRDASTRLASSLPRLRFT